jgi:aminoglycoside phosphotransferase
LDRYVPFNVSCLQATAAEAVGRQRCISIENLAEGGFNRVFLLRIDDGFEVIAKIPYRNAVPAHYLTASEVATMQFVQQQLGIPVPSVYAWSSDKSNPVGVEYIIMQKVGGVPLSDIWWLLTGKQLLIVIEQLVQFQSKMFKTPLSSYGSLYFKTNLPLSQGSSSG